MTDYEVKLYKPGRDAAFAESGIANEFRPAFNDAYEESYEEFMQGIEEIDELPEPQEGDIATIINLNGSIDLLSCGFSAEALASQPRDGYRSPMGISQYIDVYFNTAYGRQFMEVIQNPGAPQPSLTPPVRVGAKVTIATFTPFTDENGNEVQPLPDNVVAVTAAPPPQYIETNEMGQEVASSYSPQVSQPWYVFLLKDNLDIYALEELQAGEYRITNFDGEYPRLMKKEDGSLTRKVEEYVQDLIANGYTPPGFGVGSIGFVEYDRGSPGTLRFGNPEKRSRRQANSWFAYLIPSNVIPLRGNQNPQDKLRQDEEDYRERQERVRVGKLEARRTKVDNTKRNLTWVETSTGQIESSDKSPGNSWRKCPKITILDKEISSDLRSLAKGLEESSYDVQIITTKNGTSGSPIALKIGGEQVSEILAMLEQSAAPLRTKSGSGKTAIIRYR